jgi:hypothetical protein
MHDISEGGFLASGHMNASVWDRIEASIRLKESNEEREVRLYGTIMHAHPDGERQVVGVRIDGFGSPEDKRTYIAFTHSLNAIS